jgi:hypothetical protein
LILLEVKQAQQLELLARLAQVEAQLVLQVSLEALEQLVLAQAEPLVLQAQLVQVD